MKYILIMMIVFLAADYTVAAARLNHERYYQEVWCSGKGVMEYRLPDRTRVDCLTSSHAYEFDFANKWAEAIGQSLHYAALTGKRAGIILIVEDPIKDQKYIDRVRHIIQHFNLQIDLRIATPPLQ